MGEAAAAGWAELMDVGGRERDFEGLEVGAVSLDQKASYKVACWDRRMAAAAKGEATEVKGDIAARGMAVSGAQVDPGWHP